MTVQQANKLVADTIEPRFGMIGRFWSPQIAKAYMNVLLAYDYEPAKTVIADHLERADVPPTDTTLDRLIRDYCAAHRDADTYRPDFSQGYDQQKRGVSGPAIAKAAFSRVWQQNHPNGEEEPQEWLKMLDRVEKARRAKGLHCIPSDESDPFAERTEP